MASDKKLFAIMGATEAGTIVSLLATHFPDAHLQVGPGQWLVVGKNTMTTQELSAQLGMLGKDSVNDGIVLSVTSYFGRATITTWEWLSAKMGASDDSSSS